MKARRTKSRERAVKDQSRRVAISVLLVVILLLAVASAYFIYIYSNQSNPSEQGELRAAIVDQLSSTFPNQTFKATATSILKQAGYKVDYYPSKDVTVDFYRYLPTHRYNVIIFRVHSALASEKQPPVALFTSEPLSAKYPEEQILKRLRGVAFLPYEPGDPTFFGIPPEFISHSMKGNLQDATVIAMGCDGLTYTGMAEAFREKGAKIYIGWKGSVLVEHADQATIKLLTYLVFEGQTVHHAVRNTMNEIGADPVEDRELAYYPPYVGGQTLRNIDTER